MTHPKHQRTNQSTGYPSFFDYASNQACPLDCATNLCKGTFTNVTKGRPPCCTPEASTASHPPAPRTSSLRQTMCPESGKSARRQTHQRPCDRALWLFQQVQDLIGKTMLMLSAQVASSKPISCDNRIMMLNMMPLLMQGLRHANHSHD